MRAKSSRMPPIVINIEIKLPPALKAIKGPIPWDWLMIPLAPNALVIWVHLWQMQQPPRLSRHNNTNKQLELKRSTPSRSAAMGPSATSQQTLQAVNI